MQKKKAREDPAREPQSLDISRVETGDRTVLQSPLLACTLGCLLLRHKAVKCRGKVSNKSGHSCTGLWF